MTIRDRVKKLIRVKASDLKPNPRNWRTHPAGQKRAMAAALNEIGFADAVLAREVDGGLELIDGHLRRETAADESVPVLVLDVTADEADKLLVTLDPLASMATTDAGKLSDLLSHVTISDKDLQQVANETAAAAGIGGDEMADGLTDPDEVPDAPEPITKPGDLWLLGDHRVLCGDSTNEADVGRVMDEGRADMMFTDPPYGVNYTGGVQFDGKGGAVTDNREALANDDSTDLYGEFLPVVMPFVDGPCYLWFADSKALPVYQAVHDCGGVISALIIWHKTNATYAAMNAQYKQRHEPCLYFKPKGATLRWCGPTTASTLWEFKRDSSNEFHPTQKPVILATTALKNHIASSIADPFLGSGATLIAAEQLGRKCYGLEISPQYCDVIVKRWENFTGNVAERVSAGTEAVANG